MGTPSIGDYSDASTTTAFYTYSGITTYHSSVASSNISKFAYNATSRADPGATSRVDTGATSRMESDCSTSSESCLNDKKHIKELEKMLKKCSLEIGYLQDELILRSIESNCMSEHVHNLELKLEGFGILQTKVSLLTEELLQSDAKCLRLTQEIKIKDEDFKNYLIHIEELESAISSSALESQCEIESLRLEMLALEERCFQAESLNQQIAQDKSKMHEVLEEYEKQLHESHNTITFLEMENNELQVKLQESERKFRVLHCKVEQHLSNLLKDIGSTSASMQGESNKNLSSGLKEKYSLLNGICTCKEVLCPLVSKLNLLTIWDENAKNEMQEMTNQILEAEFLVETLKEELREEKIRSKEEAEDLTQAMAELRYEIMGMLEEECKRRASIEQASLRRIQELEEQVNRAPLGGNSPGSPQIVSGCLISSPPSLL